MLTLVVWRDYCQDTLSIQMQVNFYLHYLSGLRRPVERITNVECYKSSWKEKI